MLSKTEAPVMSTYVECTACVNDSYVNNENQ